MKSNLIDIEVHVHHKTEKAVFISDTGDKADAEWVPLSQIEIEEDPKNSIATVTMPEWLAKEKGFI